MPPIGRTRSMTNEQRRIFSAYAQLPPYLDASPWYRLINWNGNTAARSLHNGGVHALLVEGHVKFFSDNINLATWQALGSRSGKEVVGDF